MKKRIILALCSLAIAVGGIGMSSLTHEERPVSEMLLAEAAMEEEPEEIIEEVEEIKACELGCGLPTGHEGDCVVSQVKEIEVVLKSTSMERDLKVKFVDKKSGKVISGADFKMKVTNSKKSTKEYSDHDNDGIIWVKDIDGGKYTVEMVELEGYVTAKTLSADVKNKIEYKVVEIEDEVKSESQVEVSKEDAEFGGADKDESTSNSAVLKDTVEFVESSKKEEVVSTGVQKRDENGDLMYESKKKDALGQPMRTRILSESAEFHTFSNNVCTRCGVQEPASSETPETDGNQGETNNGNQGGETGGNQGETNNGNQGETNNGNQGETNNGNQGETNNGNQGGETGGNQGEGNNENQGEGNEDTNGEGVISVQNEEEINTAILSHISTIWIRKFNFLRTSGSSGSFINYDPESSWVYDTSSPAVYETETKTTYYGWQTIDGATYYFDKNGKKVTGQQVIQGISYTFSSDGVRSGTIGIDVSKYQKNINWTKIKNAGINFVIIRCGYRGYGSGVLVQDEMFVSHITGAKAAGLRVGIYFFSQAINEAEAVEEASMAISLAKKYGINMPIAIDSEYANGGKGRADGLSKSDRTKITRAFCDTVKNSGYTPMVYASKSWFSSHLDVSKLSSYRIWVAHYAEKCGYTGNYHIWQHTDKGKVDGYSGYLDMNISSI
ncbi:MAG: hypothetical protein IKT88_01745 [Lachnospiraceae bacterium]|nr:hypothetical protein [Lachnospiraceae bacterium]